MAIHLGRLEILRLMRRVLHPLVKERMVFETTFTEVDPWQLSTSDWELGKYGLQLSLISDFRLDASEILEIGCAQGVFTSMLASKFVSARILATDISMRAISLAKQRTYAANVTFLRSDILTYISKIPPAYYDVIVVSEVIGHLRDRIPPKKLREFLLELAGKLAANGVLVTSNRTTFEPIRPIWKRVIGALVGGSPYPESLGSYTDFLRAIMVEVSSRAFDECTIAVLKPREAPVRLTDNYSAVLDVNRRDSTK